MLNFINLMENKSNTATPLSSFPFVPPSSVCVSVLYLNQSLLLPPYKYSWKKFLLRLKNWWLGVIIRLAVPSPGQTASHPGGLQLVDDINVDHVAWD